MKKPVILLSCGFDRTAFSPQRRCSRYYGDALDAGGALPVIYAGGSPSALAAMADGLLLTGGGDLHPALFRQSVQSDRLSIDEERDREELHLLDAFVQLKKPVLGICRGLQVLNVFLGGTLVQDMAGHADGVIHTVTARPGSRIAAFCGASFPANSYHHQAVDEIAPGFEAAARAADGTIEALEHVSYPLLGVQWHPERQTPLTCQDASADHLSLFSFWKSYL